jgi:thiol:disulfide interchange protein DsbD
VVLSVCVLALAVAGVLEKKLHWRNPVYTQRTGTAVASNSGIDWKHWSAEAVAAARAEGRPVLVDFTADWCFSCKLNLATSIEIESVEKKLKEINAVALLGDFTGKNPVIAEELQRFKRSAVPLVLVYPADANEPPLILPALLTPDIVLEALDRAAKKSPTAANSLSARAE